MLTLDVKEHPTLMKAEMVRAILALIKRQTRRVVTYRNTLVDGARWPKDRFACLDLDNAWVDPGPSPAGNPGPYLKAEYKGGWKDHPAGTVHRLYPQWQVEDLLWVRERFNVTRPFTGDIDHDLTTQTVHYYADDNPRYRDNDKWKPSIHMPRWACRLTLEVKAVRVERVQEISEEDARAEGCDYDDNPIPPDGFDETGRPTARLEFEYLWDSIAKRGFGWKRNPWVWVIEFERSE